MCSPYQYGRIPEVLQSDAVQTDPLASDSPTRAGRFAMGKGKLGPDFWAQWYRLDDKQHTEQSFREELATLQLQHELWQPGRSLLDVGGGPAWMGAFLMAKYGVDVTTFEVPFTAQCDDFLASPFNVNFFFGELHLPPRSYDAVSFVSMLHHAAEHTERLLEQAAVIARRWIIVVEDLDVVSNRKQLQAHDGSGIFRSEVEWTNLLSSHCRGFALLRNGWLGTRVLQRLRTGNHSTQKYVVAVNGARSYYQAWFLLQRTPE